MMRRGHIAVLETQGMTLIETLIAVAVMSFVMTLVYSGFSQTTRVKDRVIERGDQEHRIFAALTRMSRELSMAYVSAQVNPSESLQVVRSTFVGTDRGSNDRLDFTAFSHQRLYANAHESDQEELSYFLTTNPDNRSHKVLARRSARRVDDRPGRGGSVQMLLDNVVGLNIHYYDNQTNEWVGHWNSDQGFEQPNRLPSQVRITLEVKDGRNGSKTRKYVMRATPRLIYALNHAVYMP